MRTNVIKKITGILIISIAVITNISGQDRNDVIKAYNDGAKAMQTDPQAAISAFETVVILSDKVGETAADLKQKAVQVLPGLYLKVAANAMNAKKPAPEVIKAAKTAMAAAEKYGSQTGKDNAGKMILQGYYYMGSDFFAKKDYDNSL